MSSFGQTDALNAVLRVGAALEALEISYAVVGSFASSVHGVFRTTNDVDIVAAFRDEHVDRFVALLGEDFYVDADMIRDAIRHRSEFNLIFQPAIFKVDVFVPRLDLIVRRELSRAENITFEEQALRVSSAEDVVVQKLHWYQQGGQSSERQWQDALGVVKIRRGALDVEYLRETAEALGVLDLLERLLA